MSRPKYPVQRPASAYMANKLLNAAGSGDGAQLCLRQADLDVLGQHTNIAGQGQFASPAHGIAVDRRNGGKGELFQPIEKQGDSREVSVSRIERVQNRGFRPGEVS